MNRQGLRLAFEIKAKGVKKVQTVALRIRVESWMDFRQRRSSQKFERKRQPKWSLPTLAFGLRCYLDVPNRFFPILVTVPNHLASVPTKMRFSHRLRSL